MKQPGQPPVRLDASDSDAPDALKRALNALSHEGPNAAELQRMRERLLPKFEAPVPPGAGWLGLMRGPLRKVVLGVVVAAAIGALLRFGHRSDVAWHATTPVTPARTEPAEQARPNVEPAADNEPATQARADQRTGLAKIRSATESAAPSPKRAQTTARSARAQAHEVVSHAARSTSVSTPAAAPDAPAANGGEVDRRSPVVRPIPDRAALEVGPSSPAADPRAPAVDRTTSANRSTRFDSPDAMTGDRAAQPTAPREEAQPASTHAPAPAPLDEAALLHRARQLAASDPRASLQLLNAHKQRFANGMLSQEREVLAIELLRSLSRKDEADQRARAFRRDFPNSVYLSRLR